MEFKKIFQDKIFWIFSIAIAGAVFFAAMDSNHEYKAEIEILLLPKNEIVARNLDKALENARQITSSLAFYEAIVRENEGIDDPAKGLPGDKRKAEWNEMMELEKIEESGMLKLVITTDSQSQAKIIAEEGARSLAAAMSRYYNIRTELDIRITDGPIVAQAEKMNIFIWLLLSIIVGLLSGLFFNLAVDFIMKRSNMLFIQHHKEEFRLPEKRPSIFPTFSLPENIKPGKIGEKKDIFGFKVADEKTFVEKNILSFGKRSAAPANLPIAEDLNFQTLPSEDQTVVSVEKNEGQHDLGEAEDFSGAVAASIDENKEEDLKREATPEEVRSRLNKLLGGGMLK